MKKLVAVLMSYLTAAALVLPPALTPTLASADFITSTGDGYSVLIDSRGRCTMAWANTALASNVKCQEGAPLFRSDEGKWYSMQSGSWTAVSFAAQTLTAPVITGIVTDPTTTVGVGAGTMTGMTITENGSGATHRTTFTFAAASQATTDTGGANGGQGSTLIYTFPQGYIITLGATCNLTTLAGAGGIADGAAVVHALGTTAAAAGNATLTTTEADWIASFAGTMTAGAGSFAKTGTGTFTAFDGHTTAITLYLNSAEPDADVSAADTIAYTGSCVITWVNQGDIP